MDKLFQMNAVTFFSERYGSLTNKFRKENDKNTAFLQSMYNEPVRTSMDCRLRIALELMIEIRYLRAIYKYRLVSEWQKLDYIWITVV